MQLLYCDKVFYPDSGAILSSSRTLRQCSCHLHPLHATWPIEDTPPFIVHCKLLLRCVKHAKLHDNVDQVCSATFSTPGVKIVLFSKQTSWFVPVWLERLLSLGQEVTIRGEWSDSGGISSGQLIPYNYQSYHRMSSTTILVVSRFANI